MYGMGAYSMHTGHWKKFAPHIPLAWKEQINVLNFKVTVSTVSKVMPTVMNQ
jgi:hypothetical protein